MAGMSFLAVKSPVAPKITIVGGGGTDASATCAISTSSAGIIDITMTNEGSGYLTSPSITFSSPSLGAGTTAVGIASLSSDGKIKTILLSKSGIGYSTAPIITISPPSISGINATNLNYIFNESVTGSISGTSARVKSWNYTTKNLKVSILTNSSSKGFYPGEILVGSKSNAAYIVESFDSFNNYDKYSENKIIQSESEQILDFSESNPFGSY